jgi:hypothetical protein
MNLATTIELHCYHPLELWDTDIKGFNHSQKEGIRSVLHRIPTYLMTNFKAIESKADLGAKHGRYDENTHIIYLNPKLFQNKIKFGQGPGRKIDHFELTLAHEIGHSIYYFMSPKERAAWQKLSGWKEGTGEGQAPPYKEKRPGWPKETSSQTHSQDADFTRHYAERNEHEDFADTFAWYVMGRKERVPPEKAQFLDKLFKVFKRSKPEGPQ